MAMTGRGSDKFLLRLPEGLRGKIKERAEARGRSMNAEIVQMLSAAESGLHSRNTIHELKTLDRYWDAIASGEKTFEVRLNDRAFQTGDILHLIKVGEDGYRHRLDGSPKWLPPIRKQITYLLQGGQFGIEPGHCVLGLGDVEDGIDGG